MKKKVWGVKAEESLNLIPEHDHFPFEHECGRVKDTDNFNVEKKHKARITNVRDCLVNLQDLVTVCITSLISETVIPATVSNVLHFFVNPQLEKLEEELRTL